jgi:uncharacterized protein (DUF1800 family)
MKTLGEVDPAWAWAPFEPSEECPWNRPAAAHLYRRAGFGASSQQLDDAVAQSPGAAVDQLLNTSRDASAFDDEMATMTRLASSSQDPNVLSAVWLYRMLHGPAQLLEKLTLFWHGHFATSNAKVKSARLMLEQNDVLRRHALGPFEATMQAIARDPAMLIYLDSETNRKIHPNENFARETLELFCLGLGHYDEHDVQELARCFTGAEVRDQRYQFNRFQYDAGEKSFLGASGTFDAEDAVRVVVERPATAHFLASKLFAFYVCDEPAPPEALVAPLAEELSANELRIEAALRCIFTSNLFYSDAAIGRKIRSPVELAIGLSRSLEATCSTTELARMLRPLGQAVFFPPNVKGWPGGRSWINSTTLLGRANLVHRVLQDGRSRFAGGSLDDFAKERSLTDPEACVNWLSDLLLATPLPHESRRVLVEMADAHAQEGFLARIMHMMATLPEFQLA